MLIDGVQLTETTTGVASGIASLNPSGKLESSQLPDVSITDTFVAANQAAMLALTAQTGDVCVRIDLNKSFILKGVSAATLADWQELLSPVATVTSVAGRTGAITLAAADVSGLSAVATSNSYTDLSNKPTIPSAYTLPIATDSALGGVKVGSGLAIDGGTGALSVSPVALPYDVAFSVFGAPTASEVLLRFVTTRAYTIATNFAASVAKAAVAATANTVFVVKKNGTQVATITFAAAGTTGTFSTQAAVTYSIGDTLSVTAPASADATLADIDFTFTATLS